MAIWRGTGDGGLLPPDYCPVSRGASAIQATDLDHDDRPDLVVLNPYANNVTVILNKTFCR